MTIPFQCEHCQKPLRVNDTLAGKKVKCPGCQAVLTVPTAVAATAGAGPAPAPKPPAPAKGANGAASPGGEKAVNGVKPPAGAPPKPAPPAAAKPAAPPKPPAAAAPASAKPPAPAPAKAPTNGPPAAKPPVSAGGTPPSPAKAPPSKPAIPKAPEPDAEGMAKPPAVSKLPPATSAPAGGAPRPPAAKSGEAPRLPESLKATMKGVVPPEPPAPKTSDSAPGTTRGPGAAKPPTRPAVPKAPELPAGKTSDSAPGKAKVPDAIKQGLKPAAPKKAAPFKPPPKKPANGDGKPPVDADELAASLLFEDEKKPEPEAAVVAGKPIKAECFICGETGEYPAELGGKQAPCHFCKRIMKIPHPVSEKPKDWRDVEKRPSGAKRDIQELDDAWGTDVRANVGIDTLEATGAIEIKTPKEPLPTRIKRWAYLAAIVALMVAAGWFAWKKRITSVQTNAIASALSQLDKDGKGPKLIANEAAAEIHRGAGEFYLRENQLEDAEAQFKLAQGALHPARPTLERDIGLLELAITITDLGGNPKELDLGTRRKWQDVRELTRPTLGKITYPETRADAARRLTRRLIARGQTAVEREALSREAELMVLSMAGGPDERPELLARIGLELLLAGEQALAERIALKALKIYTDTKPSPAVSPPLVALLVALGKQKEANELAPPPTEQGVIPVESRVGHALGLALQDDWDKAKGLAAFQGGGEAVDRLQAYLALIELGLAKNKQSEAAALTTEAAKYVGVPRVTPWMRYVLVRSGARAGKVAEMRELAKNVFSGKDSAALLNRAQVEVLRGDLLNRAGQSAAAEMQAEAEKKEQAFPPALVLLARHNARYGSGARAEIERWEPESFRALGLIGVALGMQDRSADAPDEAKK